MGASPGVMLIVPTTVNSLFTAKARSAFVESQAMRIKFDRKVSLISYSFPQRVLLDLQD